MLLFLARSRPEIFQSWTSFTLRFSTKPVLTWCQSGHCCLADIWESHAAFSGWLCLARGEWDILLLGQILRPPGDEPSSLVQWRVKSPLSNSDRPRKKSQLWIHYDQIKLFWPVREGVGIPPHFNSLSNVMNLCQALCSARWVKE